MSNRIAKLSFAGAVCATLAVACHTSSTSSSSASSTEPSSVTAEETKVPEVSVGDVERFVKEKSATILDANDGETRKEYGVVPGAVLLSGKEYPLSTLPASKTDKLVFYCGGTQCRASDKAAARAASAGYSDVAVMRAGIRGWKDAGQTTSPAPQS
ncbi:MAG TPA: rhodanese-like domain-containing protein [Polyangiaceae bacterium]|jgi:rhodanese-related sulfurtransferase|nr:rhodanese-like domain-containing protein [Polyangiaceae bacterium]